MNDHVSLAAVLLIAFTFVGCDPPKPVAGVSSAPGAPPPPPGSEPPPPESKVGAFAGTIDDLAARPAPPLNSPPVQQSDDSNVERVKAEKGVGIKGRSLDEYEGVVVTPVKAYFAARERIFFEIEFPANYDRWKVLADGVPKDFDDLKAKFLDPLGLTSKLPKLPQGHKYVWDASTEQLLVERPKRKE